MSKKNKPKWWNAYWLMIFLTTIIIGIALPILRSISWDRATIYLMATLVFEVIAYYVRVRPSIRINRLMYILIGVPLGFVFWYILTYYITFGLKLDTADNLTYVIVSLAVCYAIGFLVGDLIGKSRNYKGPEQYQP